MKQNIVKEKSLQLSFEAINIYKMLVDKKEFILSKQFLRAATSIGANIHEADAGYSKKDFTAKMSIAAKEARETNYWVILIKHASIIKYDWIKFDNILEELTKLLTAIVKTSNFRSFESANH